MKYNLHEIHLTKYFYISKNSKNNVSVHFICFIDLEGHTHPHISVFVIANEASKSQKNIEIEGITIGMNNFLQHFLF